MGKRSRQRNREARQAEGKRMGATRSAGPKTSPPHEPARSSERGGASKAGAGGGIDDIEVTFGLVRSTRRGRGAGGKDRITAEHALLRFEAMTHIAKARSLSQMDTRAIREAFDDLGTRDRSTIGAELKTWLDRALAGAFGHGWLPNDVSHFVRIKIDDTHDDAATEAIESWARRHGRMARAPMEWSDAFDEIVARRNERVADRQAQKAERSERPAPRGATARVEPIALFDLPPAHPAPASEAASEAATEHQTKATNKPTADSWCQTLSLIAVLHTIIELPELCDPPKAWKRPAAERAASRKTAITSEEIEHKAR